MAYKELGGNTQGRLHATRASLDDRLPTEQIEARIECLRAAGLHTAAASLQHSLDARHG